MKVYLAGKIGKNDWRHRFVDYRLNNICQQLLSQPTMEWPILPKAIANRHDYCGPYFISCDHGCFHGEDTHGYGANPAPSSHYGLPQCYEIVGDELNSEDAKCHGYDDFEYELRRHVVNSCLEAIEECDVVFVWIDDLTAFGSIFELGFARALDKDIYLYEPLNFARSYDDLWFIEEAIPGSFIYADTVHDAFKDFLIKINTVDDEAVRRSKIESPMELKFYEKVRRIFREIEPQWEIQSDGHRYRADFAIPSKKIVFEIDGHDYHKTKEQRTNDTRRERNLQKAGWKVIRFTGSEIYNNLDKCVLDAYKLVSEAGK